MLAIRFVGYSLEEETEHDPLISTLICLPLLGCNKDEPVSSVDTYDPPDVWTDTEWVQDSEVPEPGDSESADSETDNDARAASRSAPQAQPAHCPWAWAASSDDLLPRCRRHPRRGNPDQPDETLPP